MSIDISQFIQVFLEESFEGLDVMESQLLTLKPGDDEAINAVFRAAHSIKGGAGSFGFSAVADFTHGVETLLDEMRDGRRETTQEAVSLLLQAGDCIRSMLIAGRDGVQIDSAHIGEIEARLKAMLGAPSAQVVAEQAACSEPVMSMRVWHIRFSPYPDMLRSGNDPVRMFSVLDELGELQVSCHADRLPLLSALDPDQSYLSWDLTLTGDVTQAAIDEVFEWVDGECELQIELQPSAAESDVEQHPAPSVQTQENSEVSEPSPVSSGQNKAPGGSIRVNTDKIDILLNLVGELVITQSMLSQIGGADEDLELIDTARLEKLRAGLSQLERNTRELQENVMSIRMLPISFSFNRFPRLVRDMSAKLGKKIELRFSGEQTELDKTVMEKIGDPLVHLVRNAMDHGLETPQVRRDAGKAETGVLQLTAFHQGGSIVIEISDDGAGLNRDRIRDKAIERGLVKQDDMLSDEQIYDLIFLPGFSTAEKISDLSGRGVGMDVVRKNIKSLGGTVEVNSTPGVGSNFIIRLPLTLAILDGQLIQVAEQTFVIPLVSIVESLQIRREFLNSVTDRAEVYKLREDYLPVVSLTSLFGLGEALSDLNSSLLVVVEAEGKKIGLVVDDLLGQQQVVIKALESNFRQVDGLSGATILGDGTVALILDVASLIELSRHKTTHAGASPAATVAA